MNKVYFTSDIHFAHEEALVFDNRPWETLEEMHEAMILAWNAKVTDADHVYILGDLCYKAGRKYIKLIERLHGNLHLIRGNHDMVNSAAYKALFTEITKYKELHVTLASGKKKRVVLSHYPIHLYHGHTYGAIHLYGHLHNLPEEKIAREIRDSLIKHGIPCEMYNVWCGFYDWRPADLDEILDKNREIVKLNHDLRASISLNDP